MSSPTSKTPEPLAKGITKLSNELFINNSIIEINAEITIKDQIGKSRMKIEMIKVQRKNVVVPSQVLFK